MNIAFLINGSLYKTVYMAMYSISVKFHDMLFEKKRLAVVYIFYTTLISQSM